ncbi:MAG TPA: bifunctional glutamate N-acetyltransferase/amino-acid acetyltransferase ArgJ [Pseudonocardiaceae bacterium]|jgi:glutamate N-acetyltransferase/amino-acid N-acetyltransferase|nr:bifunctional glutamate N-acetyltransferase/amino-acid acetyltransferase ArgJ [Pseudonocardiaceae bacterium]
MTTATPQGFRIHAGRCGIREDRDDFVVIASDVPASTSAMFTRSRFAGPSVTISRTAAPQGTARAVVALSGNANVATGDPGHRDALEIRDAVARVIGSAPDEVFVASTGLIGQRYPMAAIRAHLDELRAPFAGTDFGPAAAAIMTTDTHPKLRSVSVGGATITGVAKGVGMMEPNMATLLTFFCTDARIATAELDPIFRRVIDRTFNALSIDTDTSTSDTAIVLANGLAGPVDRIEFEQALGALALDLVKDIARDGEGATTLIEVRVTGARDDEQARRVGKVVVNSPLVKTAVHGADPNWGRVAMAIGKCEDDVDIVPEHVAIRFGDIAVYPEVPGDAELDEVRVHLRGDAVLIGIELGIGRGAFSVYGCDLTEGYVRLNADYST